MYSGASIRPNGLRETLQAAVDHTADLPCNGLSQLSIRTPYLASVRATIAGMKRLFTACIALLSCGVATADLVQDVRCREISFSKSVENNDIEAFRSHIDADARFIGASVLRGVDEIAEGWSVFFTGELPKIKWRPQVIEVLEDGRLALSRGPFISVSKNAEGDKVETWGTFNSIWRLNDDGNWRVVFDAGNAAPGSPGKETLEFVHQEDNCP